MTLAEIDTALEQWENRLSSAAHNLFDLQADATYQCITGTGGMPRTPLTGVTQSRVAPALENIGTLFQCFDLLRSTIDRAVYLRRDLPKVFGGDQKIREIEQLLTGKSVRIPPNQIPIAKRSLLTGADDQGCISPDELLKSMVKAFETARDGVLAIDKAWHELGVTIGDAARRIAAVKLQALDETEARELDGLEHALSLRRTQLQSDPLGTSLDIEKVILPAVARLETAVGERARLLGQTEAALSAAHGNLQALRNLQREATSAWVEAQAKVSIPGELPAPLPEAKLESLAEWLARLQEKFDGGMLAPVSVGLQNWNSDARVCVSQLKKICEANRAPLELRKELRGRMNALKAKALAYGVEEDAELRQLATDADALLYIRPTPLDRASEVVAQYQKLLLQRAQAGGKAAG